MEDQIDWASAQASGLDEGKEVSPPPQRERRVWILLPKLDTKLTICSYEELKELTDEELWRRFVDHLHIFPIRASDNGPYTSPQFFPILTEIGEDYARTIKLLARRMYSRAPYRNELEGWVVDFIAKHEEIPIDSLPFALQVEIEYERESVNYRYREEDSYDKIRRWRAQRLERLARHNSWRAFEVLQRCYADEEKEEECS